MKDYRIISSNKRERTFTILVTHEDGTTTKYRTIRQPKSDFDYYTNYATRNDLVQFMKTDEYYTI